jgi:hypothetical protein
MKADEMAYKTILKATYGVLFFGCPNKGMNIESLIPMCERQPNLPFLQTLGQDSAILRRLCRDWPIAFSYADSRIIAFYETQLSPTAIKVRVIFRPTRYLSRGKKDKGGKGGSRANSAPLGKWAMDFVRALLTVGQ